MAASDPRRLGVIACVFAVAVWGAAPTSAAWGDHGDDFNIAWEGHGSDSVECGDFPEHGIEAGDPYIHWVLTPPTGGDVITEGSVAMTWDGGSASVDLEASGEDNEGAWQGWHVGDFDIDSLDAHAGVSAESEPGNLVISNFCPGVPDEDEDEDGAPDDENGPPDDENGPPDDENGPPDDENGPPDDENGPPDDENGAPEDEDVTPEDEDVIPEDEDVTPEDVAVEAEEDEAFGVGGADLEDETAVLGVILEAAEDDDEVLGVAEERDELPVTGAPLTWLVAVALLLAAAGGGLVAASRPQ